MRSNKAPVPTYYPALTGIRAVAAMMVVVFHMVVDINGTNLPALLRLPLRFMAQWHLGVNFFFVLSGFLITARYAEQIKPSLDWARRYMQNRFARIYPVYFLLTAVSFAIVWWRPDLVQDNHEWDGWLSAYTLQDKATVLLLNFTLLRGYFNDLLTLGLPTAWSLTVEETFYVAAPFVLLSINGNWRRLPLYALGFLVVGSWSTPAWNRLTASCRLLASC